MNLKYITLLFSFCVFIACQQGEPKKEEKTESTDEFIGIELGLDEYTNASSTIFFQDGSMLLDSNSWVQYDIEVPETGRYRVELTGNAEESVVWIEDYINNEDDRTYDITGNMQVANGSNTISIDGSPLKGGVHEIKIHNSNPVAIESIRFELLKPHQKTPLTYQQQMSGAEWDLVWSDEFEGSGLPDTSKWSYNIGNWGWGNKEPQYYTELKMKNARQEDGNLIIEAHKNDDGNEWTSARLTTQGKESFLFGKIEFRAKVPAGRGTWAAGWLLGDSYEDELSWPYCGEIDVLECVGYEIDDSTGNGINHATCHTRAYYFKQGNQIGSQIEMENMDSEFHTYAIEWYPDVIYGVVDGERYYTYDKNANELEWPFSNPQNIIINLAVGGGWGGAKGIDENWDHHQFILDYVRVYQLK